MEAGGHSVPEEDIERRFTRTLENLPKEISEVDQTTLFDNSGRELHRAVADLQRESFAFENAPEWASDAAIQFA